ncbi:hypothetical protein PRK78_002554 [Emydomyces testavorans]|uniref:CBM21 domain-containing protein n=1 Tax=Emydomyces testavorans TaxID=2070801 RepID=A0AAF0DFA7_9EURO|nr:hypothetical protein PRK78_002554 [Emydomyces testavorans]
MPYTPPSSVTCTNRPGVAPAYPRRGGFHERHKSEPPLTSSGRFRTCASPSSSYIHRHRRSPNIHESISLLPPRDNSTNVAAGQGHATTNSSPAGWKPPQTNTSSLIQSCAVLSPPETRQNSSDEDEQNKGKEEQKVRVELQDAFMSMEQQTSRLSVQDPIGITDSVSPRAELPLVADSHRKPPSIDILPLRSQSPDGLSLRQLPEIEMHTPEQSDREDEPDLAPRPPMIRKKSGELVRPALRMRKRPCSVPGTPTFAKNVHFDVQLEQVRHFLQLDMPVAVSTGSSPAEEYDGDTEFPFGPHSVPKAKHFQWEARITNFPDSAEISDNAPVRLERLFLSADNRYLVGIVAVANLAFQKHVAARFTLDHWKTVSEVEAEYNNDPHSIKNVDSNYNYDRFHFNIRLADLADLEAKTMFICIRYLVNGLEFWDNNMARNYHVKFSKRYNPTTGRHDVRGDPTGSYPRTNRNITRPLSMPPLSNDVPFVPARSFRSSLDDDFAQLPEQVPRSRTDDDLLETPTKRTKPAAQAFATRYNFGSSLSAAMQPGGIDTVQVDTDVNEHVASIQQITGTPETKSIPDSQSVSYWEPMRPSDLLSAKPCHQSPGYKELVDKYCFYETSSPTTVRTRSSDQKRTISKRQPISRRETSPSDLPLFSSQESSKDERPQITLPSRSPRSRSSSRSRSDFGSNSSSPVIFSHSLHQEIPTRLLSESPAPTAIRG